MSPRLASLALLAAGAVGAAGCDSIRSMLRADSGEDTARPSSVASLQDQSGRTTDDPTPTRGERTITPPVNIEAFPGGGDAKFADATVPVLAPASLSVDQATDFADSYRTTPDGYFARMDLEDFDVVVNGTRVFAVAPQAAGAPPARDITQYQFSETETGVSVTFNRFGADYSIEFICPGAGGDGGACVTEARAAEFVERLVPVGGGGR